MSTLTKKEYWAKIDQLKEKYPDYCEAQDVECLNLIMRKEFAQQIIGGEKKVEFRAVSDHYISRLVDKKVVEFKKKHSDDEDVQEFCDPLRIVKKKVAMAVAVMPVAELLMKRIMRKKVVMAVAIMPVAE